MSSFVYALPLGDGVTLPSDKRIIECGIGYAFGTGRGRSLPCSLCGANDGPASKPCDIVGHPVHVDPKHLGYHPDRQTWLRIPGSEAWVGYWKDDPPNAKSLQREHMMNGHQVLLGDGDVEESYAIPVARAFVDDGSDALRYRINLPTATGMDPDGNWVSGSVIPSYAELWAIAEQWWDEFSGAVMQKTHVDGKGVEFDFRGFRDAGLLALATNYRVGIPEVAALGLFDDRSVLDIMMALIDWPTMEQWDKKKANLGPVVDGSNADVGQPD